MNERRAIIDLQSRVSQVEREQSRAPVRVGVHGGSGGDGSNGNSAGSTGCCCNSMKCVNLCDLTVADVVTECDECANGATKTYSSRVASGSGWMRATATVTHVGGGCTWESVEFDITIKGVTGTYKWVFVQDGSSSTLTLTWVSGDDPVQSCAGYGETVTIEYTATTTQGQAWSCLCNSKMQLTTDRTTIPFGSGLDGEICIVPGSVATTLDPAKCQSLCYTFSVSGVTGGGPGTPSPNGDFTFVAAGVADGTDDNLCSCREFFSSRDETEDYQWFFVPSPDPTAGTLNFLDGSDGFGPCTVVIYEQTSGTTCVSDTLVFTKSSGTTCTGEAYPYSDWPDTITLTKTDCSYTGPGCDCPGGSGDGCSGYAIWTWSADPGVWNLTFENAGIAPPCETQCVAPAPNFDGDFDGDTRTVYYTCAP